MKREHFLLADIRKLKDRVSHRCSRPTCRAQTSAPASGGMVSSVGTAAHICAASPNGPRYDKNQSPKERNSIDNAIWLCNICAREIDLDESKFPATLLHEWKFEAEKVTARELGVRVIPKDDPIDTLVAVMAGVPRKILYDSIVNVHAATAKTWESLDPRFRVETQFVNGAQILGLHAKEPASFEMTIMPEVIEEFSRKVINLIEHGKELSIATTEVIISGLPILEEIISRQKGHLFIKPVGIEARTKIILRDKDGEDIDPIDDILGEVSVGRTHFSFIGYAFDGALCMEYSHPFNFYNLKISFNFKFLTERWNGKNILSIPYFEKIFDFFKKLHAGWGVQVRLDVEGGTVFKGDLTSFDDSDFIDDQFVYFSYIEMCRKLARFLNLSLFYDENFAFDGHDYDQLSKVISRIEERHVLYKDKVVSNPKCVITISVENRDFLFQGRAAIKYTTNDTSSMNVFGVSIQLPRIVHFFKNATPKIIKTLSVNDKESTLEVEFIPEDDFQYSEVYDKQ